ncbi:hypothetical protein RRG08_000718 [Elysia crispata]|uniref:Uncharacterized protein n=1 Tax=Elysia crispata TaxID=231223 RepID=A0AAE1E648_9GAST|nr:hypothetical protein RRG08_000718 [Elysia crispata]
MRKSKNISFINRLSIKYEWFQYGSEDFPSLPGLSGRSGYYPRPGRPNLMASGLVLVSYSPGSRLIANHEVRHLVHCPNSPVLVIAYCEKRFKKTKT